ncbi:MAG TPA: hypothetical protein VHO73_10505 [Methylomirabilota bacterium]|nr:hypothetical protein [Methylomirabilota bacterium]
MAERVPSLSTSVRGLGAAATGPLPSRNRRTALVLVAWIFALAVASILVAWFRN